MSTKSFFFIIAALLWSLAAPGSVQAETVVPGDLMKTATSATVYYYGYDGKRHAFPLEKVYFSWYSNFSGIKIVTDGELAGMPLGRNIVVRPGSWLVKLITDPKVYAVEPEGTLRHITSTAQASDLYGPTWHSRVIDLPDAFYADYRDGGALPASRHPTGTVFRYTGENNIYLLTNGYSRRFASLVSWSAYHYSDQFTLSVPYQSYRYPSGADVDQFKVALSDTAQTLMANERNDFSDYRKPGDADPQPQEHGLKGEYFDGKNLNQLKLTRIDSEINFDWGLNNPAMGALADADDFSVRWSGEINVSYSGEYTFYVYSDDGVRLYIDNQLVVGNWTNHKARWDNGTIYLNEGRHRLQLEYYDQGQHAIIKLAWKQQGTIVPNSVLYADR